MTTDKVYIFIFVYMTTGYEMVFEGTEREHQCHELIPGQTYRVRVAACSVGGRSDVSNTV